MNTIQRKVNVKISFFFCFLAFWVCVCLMGEGVLGIETRASFVLAKHSTMR